MEILDISSFLLGFIDFVEFVCGFSTVCRGQPAERYRCKSIFVVNGLTTDIDRSHIVLH